MFLIVGFRYFEQRLVVRMKGSRRTEAPGRNNTTAQLEEDLCRQNNKQNRQNNKQNKQNRQNNIVKSKWFH